MTFLINRCKEEIIVLFFFLVFFFAYPANVCLNGQMTFLYNICKKEIVVLYFLFCFCFFVAHLAIVGWNGQVNLSKRKIQRRDHRLLVLSTFFAYPADLCWDGKVTFLKNRYKIQGRDHLSFFLMLSLETLSIVYKRWKEYDRSFTNFNPMFQICLSP